MVHKYLKGLNRYRKDVDNYLKVGYDFYELATVDPKAIDYTFS